MEKNERASKATQGDQGQAEQIDRGKQEAKIIKKLYEVVLYKMCKHFV